jgi:uncharacterized protein YukE
MEVKIMPLITLPPFITIGPAMADIYLDLERLKAEIIALNEKKIQEINSVMRSANSCVNRLTQYGWTGESKESFLEKFAGYRKDMGVFKEHLTVFNKQLKTIHSNGKKLQLQSKKISTVL